MYVEFVYVYFIIRSVNIIYIFPVIINILKIDIIKDKVLSLLRHKAKEIKSQTKPA